MWTQIPVAYLLYLLVRGPIVDWYPYPFFDPELVSGYAGVLAFYVGIAIGILGFVWLVTSVGGRWRLADDASQGPRAR